MNHWMKKASCVFALLLGGEIGLAQQDVGSREPGQAKVAAAHPHCPVMGDEPANLTVSLSTPDGPVFFCCKDCIPKYQADPTKYAANVAAQRHALQGRPKTQVTCPACAEPADAKIEWEDGGRKVLFSSAECMNKYKSDPAKYASALANSYTYQTKCPVMGESIDPKAFATLANGAKVYFCCKGCDKKLFADPAKYAPKLVAQGILIESKELTRAPSKEQPAHDPDAHDHDHDH